MLADRVRRRPLLIAGNLVTAVAVLPLFAVHDRGDVWILYAVTLGVGFSFSVLGAGQSGLLATMLPGDELADANGILQTAREGLRLVAPLAGAALFAAPAERPWHCSTSPRSCSRPAALARMRVTRAAPAPRTGRALAELAAGARHLCATPSRCAR